MSGASRTRDIDPTFLVQLNAGTVEARTLTEALAIDHSVLLAHTVPGASATLVEAVTAAQSLSALARMRAVGIALHEHLDEATLAELAQHPSDTVRGWWCFAAASNPALQEPAALLNEIRGAADDAFFTVREWVWMAARPALTTQLDASIALLAEWTSDPSERVRRFASEALRPRGVWASHIAEFKADPAKGLPLLEPLRADPAKYVQDSVANWINDAAKTRPDWATEVAARWSRESPSAATDRIVKRGLRSIR